VWVEEFPSAPLRASLDLAYWSVFETWCSHPLRCGRHWIKKMTVPVMNVVPIRSAAGVIGSEFVSALAGKSSHPLRCGRHWISTMAVDGRILFPSAPLRASLDPESHRSFGQWLFPSAPLRASLDRFGSLFRGDVRFPSAPLRASLDLFWKKKKKRRKPRSHPLRCGRHWIFDHRRPPRWPVSSHPLRCGRHWIKGQTMYRYLLKFPSAPLRASLDRQVVDSAGCVVFPSAPLRASLDPKIGRKTLR